MREPIETTNLDTIYGSQTIPWSRPRDLLAVGALGGSGTSCFLGTVRPDGRPHAAGIGAAWHDGDLYFQCGPKTRKARNVAASPACTISLSLPGMDLVFEGEARRVADTPTLEAVAAVYREGGWPVQVEDDAFTAPYSAPSAGPPPWHLFRLTAHTVFGVATAEPYGATRWRF
jgi:Pyridoxamine 5'-phosphate oxidase